MMLVVYVHVFTMLFIHVLYAYSNLFRFRVYIFYTGVSMSTYKYTVSCLLFNDLFTTRSLIHQTHLLHVCILWFKLKCLIVCECPCVVHFGEFLPFTCAFFIRNRCSMNDIDSFSPFYLSSVKDI